MIQIRKPCTHSGCHDFALPGSPRCAVHGPVYDARARRLRLLNPDQVTAVSIRNSYRWQCVRAQQLEEHPLCCDPFGLHKVGPEPATEVHHVFGLVLRPDLAFDPRNLKSICGPCHAETEARVRRGENTAALFLSAEDIQILQSHGQET